MKTKPYFITLSLPLSLPCLPPPPPCRACVADNPLLAALSSDLLGPQPTMPRLLRLLRHHSCVAGLPLHSPTPLGADLSPAQVGRPCRPTRRCNMLAPPEVKEEEVHRRWKKEKNTETFF